MVLPRVRFTIRRMMLAVAIIAIVAGVTVLASRQRIYRGRADFYAQLEQAAKLRLRHWVLEAVRLSGQRRSDDRRQLAEYMVGYSRERASYHARLKVKYGRAARYPWLLFGPDPPPTDRTQPPLRSAAYGRARYRDLEQVIQRRNGQIGRGSEHASSTDYTRHKGQAVSNPGELTRCGMGVLVSGRLKTTGESAILVGVFLFDRSAPAPESPTPCRRR